MRGKKPVVSVVILIGPQGSANLGCCISSVLHSDMQMFELILVVNSSSKKMVRLLKTSFPEARIISMKKNSGIEGYNTGIRAALGEYVFILDNDCEIQKDTLRQLVATFGMQPPQTVALATDVYNVESKTTFYNAVPWLNAKTLFTFPGGATMFKKDALMSVGGFDRDFFLWLHEDDLTLRLLNRGYSIGYGSGIRVFHHDQESVYRPLQAKLIFRNKAWLNLKYFSMLFWPFLVVRDVLWIVSYAVYKKTPRAFIDAVTGYITGYIQARSAWKKRSVIAFTLQMRMNGRYWSYHNSVQHEQLG